MATAIQKITLSSSRDIPFNKLVLSQSNVRRVKAGVSIEELAEDIARRTLLQGLNVRPVLDAEGAETGMFEIPAGGRRYRALELLVKQKRLAKTAPVPCVVRDPATDILGEDDSLAENIQRAPLHPLDQFRAFQALREKGRSEEDIAAAFFVGVNVVKQRLRLASVAPALLDVYAEDGMSLEQLMAFTVTADHARQEQVWQAISGSWQKEPYQIRRMLTEKTVRASDRRAVFVGLDAYEAAGGVVLRDLFQSDDGGWLEDIALLDGLVAEKLKAEAETIAAEGWKWIEVAIDFPYGHTHGLRELEGVAADLTSEEQATIDALKAEYAKLEAEYDGADELPDEVDERLGEIEAALAAFDDRPVTYDPADIARAGVFVSIDAEGALSVDRGYVRPQDEAPVVEPEQDGETDPATAGARRRRSGRARGSARRHHHRRAGRRTGGRGRRGPEAAPGSPRDRADRGADAGAARQAGEHARRRVPGRAAQVLPRRLLPLLLLRDGDGGVGAQRQLPGAGAGAEGHARGQGDRRAPQGLGRAAAQGQGRSLGLAHHPHRRRAGGALRPLRLLRRQCALREGRPLRRAASRPTPSSSASPRPIAWPRPSISTWCRPAGVRPSRTISAGCPSAASSRRCRKAPASGRRNSSTT